MFGIYITRVYSLYNVTNLLPPEVIWGPKTSLKNTMSFETNKI